jgi:Phage tail repeat like
LTLLAWREIGVINLTKQWQFTNLTSAAFFRITHTLGGSSTGTLRAAIGQSIEEIVFDRRLIGYKTGIEEGQLFVKPEDVESRVLALQRLDDFPVSWSVKVEELINLATSLPLAIDDIENLRIELNAKAATIHQHQVSDVDGLQSSLDTKAATSEVTALATSTALSLTGKASIAHGHQISDISELQTNLDAKALKIEIPQCSILPPVNLSTGLIWNEVNSSDQLVESWIWINNRWQSVHQYHFDWAAGASVVQSSFTLISPLDIRYDYLFTGMLVYYIYNGPPPSSGSSDYYKIAVAGIAGNTYTVIVDSGVLAGSQVSVLIPIPNIQPVVTGAASIRALEYRHFKVGNAQGSRIGTTLKYRLVRK